MDLLDIKDSEQREKILSLIDKYPTRQIILAIKQIDKKQHMSVEELEKIIKKIRY
jgi:hypothetical protein